MITKLFKQTFNQLFGQKKPKQPKNPIFQGSPDFPVKTNQLYKYKITNNNDHAIRFEYYNELGNRFVATTYNAQTQMPIVHSEIDSNGDINGAYEKYHSNGQLWIKTTMIDNHQNGEYTTYYPNGGVRVKGLKVDNKYYGKYQQFNRNGQCIQEKIMIADEPLDPKNISKAPRDLRRIHNGKTPQEINKSMHIFKW